MTSPKIVSTSLCSPSVKVCNVELNSANREGKKEKEEKRKKRNVNSSMATHMHANDYHSLIMNIFVVH